MLGGEAAAKAGYHILDGFHDLVLQARIVAGRVGGEMQVSVAQVRDRQGARAGVERVMGFCSETEYTEFMRQTPEVERTLVRSGIHLIKFWFSVSRAEQRRRFKEREAHPLKQWKLSPIDMASLDKWDDYTRAKEAIFLHTDTSEIGRAHV